MSLSTPTPSLLLTKRLTAFLSSNLNAQVHTAALTTPSGKLLAHASPHSVGTLRTQCTVAASIWAQYSTPAASAAVSESLPHSSHQKSQSPLSETHPNTQSTGPTPSTITIQLAGGVLVIRRLHCGLLFVCIGPAPNGTSTSDSHSISATEHHQNHQQHSSVPRAMPTPQHQHHQQALLEPSTPSEGAQLHRPTTPVLLGSPSEVESVASVATTTASTATAGVVATRRQAEELARWLDDKLGTLGTLEEALGVETR